jgi:hypothetical protein
MTTIGLWQYPHKLPDNFTGVKGGMYLKATEILDAQGKELSTDNVRIPEEIALKLAETSPNPVKAANAVFLLSGAGKLRLMPLAALLFASAGR